MTLKLSVDNKAHPKGKPIGVPGLGVVPNGGSIEISDEAASRFKLATGMTVKEKFKKHKTISVSDSSSKSTSEDKEGGDG